MATKRPPEYELGRRVAAARAYREVDQQVVADKMGVRRDTIGRYEKGKIPKHSRVSLIRACADATQLPEAFFSVDFNDLSKVERWKRRDEGADLDADVRAADAQLGPDPDSGGDQAEPGAGTAEGS